VEPDPEGRVALLSEGRVEMADELTGPAARAVRTDPLLAVEGGGDSPLYGIERSVRGIDDERGVPLFSGAWLTSVGAGE
jgi:hypothetical protein